MKMTEADIDWQYAHGVASTELAKAKVEIERLQATLILAKTKLELYREAHSGEYIGGMEYTMLMRQIDHVLSGK